MKQAITPGTISIQTETADHMQENFLPANIILNMLIPLSMINKNIYISLRLNWTRAYNDITLLSSRENKA